MPRTRALMDLLPWEIFVGEGLLLHADGALSTSFSFRGPDPASTTEDGLTALTRTLVEAFRPLGDGWLLHFDLHREPAPGYPEAGSFPDPFTAALDAERRQAYEGRKTHFLSRQVLTLTWHPAVGSERRSLLDSLFQPDVDRPRLDGRIRDFENALDEITGTLSSVLRLERLGTAEQLRYLYRCVTFRDHPLAVPVAVSGRPAEFRAEPIPFTLEHVLGAGDLYGGTDLRFGETHIVPIRLAGFPDAVGPVAFDLLNDLPLPFRATVRYIPLDPHTARTTIRRKRSAWNTSGIGWRHAVAALFSRRDAQPAFTDRFGPQMAADADEALLELATQQISAGYVTATLFAASTDRAKAQARARRLVKHLRNAGYPAAVEDLNALDAYLGALPGNGTANVRRPLFTLPAAVRLAPVTSVWAGEPSHPHPVLRHHPPTILAATSGSTPFSFSAAVGDVQHAAIIGPTGAGKSVLLSLLLAQYFRYPDAQVMSLDKGYSQLALATAAGGAHYDLAPDPREGAHRFAPLAHLDTGADLQRATEWLLALLEVSGLEATPALQKTVGAGLRDLRQAASRSLATFALKVQSHDVRDALAPYVLDGPYSHLFDAESSSLRSDRFAVFEMEHVLPLREAVVTPLVLHLFDAIERRLTGQPTLVAVEELAGYLHRPLFARRFRQYLFELRKQNAGLILVNQNVTGLLESPLRSAVLEAVPTKIFLPNPSATEPSVADAYRSVGLNDRQIEILAEATPKRDYYVSTPIGARLFRLDLSPGALAILGLAGPAARQAVDDALATWGPSPADWVAPFLAEQGHADLAELVRGQIHAFDRLDETPARPPIPGSGT